MSTSFTESDQLDFGTFRTAATTLAVDPSDCGFAEVVGDLVVHVQALLGEVDELGHGHDFIGIGLVDESTRPCEFVQIDFEPGQALALAGALLRAVDAAWSRKRL